MRINFMASFFFASMLLSQSAPLHADGESQPDNSLNQTMIHIDEYQVDLDHKEITINGRLPNPCYTAPIVSLVPDPMNEATLILRVSASPPSQICFAQLEGMEETLHLPTLAKVSGLNIVRDAQYVIRSETADMVFGIDGDDLL